MVAAIARTDRRPTEYERPGQVGGQHQWFNISKASIRPEGEMGVRPVGVTLGQEALAGFDREEPMRFTSHERDFTGGTLSDTAVSLHYMHARYYCHVTAEAGVMRWCGFL